MFTDDFTEFSTTPLTEYSINIIVYDFNLHISDEYDTDMAIFSDTCQALGLYQYITFSTHRSGNTLDLLLTEIASDAILLHTHRGSFISDHTAVIAQLNIQKFTGTRHSRMVRVVKDIMADQWIKEFKDLELNLNDNFDEMVTGFNDSLKFILDKLALEKKIYRLLRPKCPWYTAEL